MTTAPLASTSHIVFAEAGSSVSMPHATYNNFWSTFKSVSQPSITQATLRIPSVQPLAAQSTSMQNIQTIEPATIASTQSTSLRIRIPLKRSYQEDTSSITPVSPRLDRRSKVVFVCLSFNFFLTLTPFSITVARRTNNSVF
jgi:hypothetical protein